jgi:hypothetical protein
VRLVRPRHCDRARLEPVLTAWNAAVAAGLPVVAARGLVEDPAVGPVLVLGAQAGRPLHEHGIAATLAAQACVYGAALAAVGVRVDGLSADDLGVADDGSLVFHTPPWRGSPARAPEDQRPPHAAAQVEHLVAVVRSDCPSPPDRGCPGPGPTTATRPRAVGTSSGRRRGGGAPTRRAHGRHRRCAGRGRGPPAAAGTAGRGCHDPPAGERRRVAGRPPRRVPDPPRRPGGRPGAGRPVDADGRGRASVGDGGSTASAPGPVATPDVRRRRPSDAPRPPGPAVAPAVRPAVSRPGDGVSSHVGSERRSTGNAGDRRRTRPAGRRGVAERRAAGAEAGPLRRGPAARPVGPQRSASARAPDRDRRPRPAGVAPAARRSGSAVPPRARSRLTRRTDGPRRDDDGGLLVGPGLGG